MPCLSSSHPVSQQLAAHPIASSSHIIPLHHSAWPLPVCTRFNTVHSATVLLLSSPWDFFFVAPPKKLALCSLLTLSAWMINLHLWKWKEKGGGWVRGGWCTGAINHQRTTARWPHGGEKCCKGHCGCLSVNSRLSLKRSSVHPYMQYS